MAARARGTAGRRPERRRWRRRRHRRWRRRIRRARRERRRRQRRVRAAARCGPRAAAAAHPDVAGLTTARGGGGSARSARTLHRRQRAAGAQTGAADGRVRRPARRRGRCAPASNASTRSPPKDSADSEASARSTPAPASGVRSGGAWRGAARSRRLQGHHGGLPFSANVRRSQRRRRRAAAAAAGRRSCGGLPSRAVATPPAPTAVEPRRRVRCAACGFGCAAAVCGARPPRGAPPRTAGGGGAAAEAPWSGTFSATAGSGGGCRLEGRAVRALAATVRSGGEETCRVGGGS